MKISNETKVGALTALAITLLILGFNFLKGKSLFRTGTFIYAKYKDTKGLLVSNPVYINGLQVGSVYDLEEANKTLDTIIVAVKLTKDINIPVNSLASITANPLGGPSMVISMGNARAYLQSGDTLFTTDNPGPLEDITHKVTPVVDQIKLTVQTLDSVLRNMNSIFDPYTKNNMQNVIANLNKSTASLVHSSESLQILLNTQTGALARTLDNVNTFTGNLAQNNERINSVMSNLQTATRNLSEADVKGTITQLQGTIARLNESIEKIGSKDGSLGLLLNDKQLYNNLQNSTRSLNTLMDDIRVHPKRYVSISIFGGKNKGEPLKAPLPVYDTLTINNPAPGALTTGSQ